MERLTRILPKKQTGAMLCAACLCTFCCAAAYAQRIQYSYDDAGNRISRKKEIVMSAKTKAFAPDTVRTGEPEPEDEAAPAQFEEMVSETKIVIYPNPTQGALRVEILGAEIPSGAHIRLYSMSGALVRQWAGISTDNTLDITAQPTGVYIMRIALDRNRVSVWKIVKQ